MLSVILYFFPILILICSSEGIDIKLLTNTDTPCPPTEICLTLEQFSENNSSWSNTNVSLNVEFLPGDHRLMSPVIINRVSNLTMYSRTKDANIICYHIAYFELISITFAHLINLTFIGCGLGESYTELHPAFKIYLSDLNINECTFLESKGRVIDAQFCSITIYKSEFSNSLNGVHYTNKSSMSDIGSVYYNNSLYIGITSDDNVVDSYYSVLHFSECGFYSNGDLFWIMDTTVILYLNEIINNRVRFALLHARYSFITIENDYVKENTAVNDILEFFRSSVLLKNATILGNTAQLRHVLSAQESMQVELQDVIIAANAAEKNNVIHFADSEVNITGKLVFANNSGTFLISSSNVCFFHMATFQSCNGSKTKSVILPGGGALTSMSSRIWFYESVTFLNNYSNDVGGGFCAIGSTLYIIKSIVLRKNQARRSGSGIYLYASTFICARYCSIFENGVTLTNNPRRGGGIHAFDSKIILDSQYYTKYVPWLFDVLFIVKGNCATKGGGIYFEANSKLIIPKDIKYRLRFEDNNATEGKMMYIDDNTYLGACSSERYVQCFIQASISTTIRYYHDRLTQIQIIGEVTNTAIFGGFLDKCFVNDVFSSNLMRGIDYLEAVTNEKNISRRITSKAVSVKFCQFQSKTSFSINIKKGEAFFVSVVALDQVNHPVKGSDSVSSHLSSSDCSVLEMNQYSQSDGCTNLSFNVYSLNDTETLYIYPKSKCNYIDNSRVLRVNINFNECTCRMGFYVLSNQSNDCRCVCDPKIFNQYAELECNLSTVVRKNQYWIGYSNDTGFLFHPFCPYDFCLPPDKVVSIDLNLPNGSDAQCDFNRTGLLCGRCKPGYSSSLSSSRCIRCHNLNWPWALMVAIVKIISGLLLVVAILMLNLTVSAGTLNGLVFYANILAADSSLFLSFGKTNLFTVFIAWLNLDLGFDVCYFKGIDAYSKAWLNIVFPTYVITVLLLIILISKYSSRFGEFIGRWNPVATLATLLLLSYTKLLRAIITALSFTILTYPTGRHSAVWLRDASVKFFGLKHFPLGLLAIVIIIVGFIYTVLLFSWQWILRLPNRRVFRWARNTRLNLFLEANLAPYKAKYRYWYGLLLFVRMALYIGIATEKSHENVTIVLAIGLIAASIQLLKTFLGTSVYRNRFIDYLNSSFYYNLLALSLARLYCHNTTSCQERSSIISISLAFILFVLILSYHILCALLEIRRFRHLISSIEQMLNLRKLKIRLIDDPRFKNNIQESEMQEAAGVVIIPTSTEVTLSPHIEDSSDDDKRSGKSANKNSADEECCNVESEETEMDDSFDNENVCKQKTKFEKGKRWTNSNTLREPLLQD